MTKLQVAIIGLILSQALFLWLLRYDIGLLKFTGHTLTIPAAPVQYTLPTVKI